MTKPLMTSPTRPTGSKLLTGSYGVLRRIGSTESGAFGVRKKRVAVGRRLGGRLGADHAGRPAAVLDHELLAEGLGELLGPRAADGIRGAARGIGQDHRDGPVRPALCLRPGPAGKARGQRCSGQPQELATMHVSPPWYGWSCLLWIAGASGRPIHSWNAVSRALRMSGRMTNSSSSTAIARNASDSGRCRNTSGSPRDSSMARRM